MTSETAIRKTILQHIRQVTGITVTDPSQPLKVDSLAVLELVMDLEREFNISIPEEKLEQLKNVTAIVEMVQTLLALSVT